MSPTVSQSMFAGALLDPARAAPAGLTDARGRPAGRRFDVYRNNVASSLAEALGTGFPVVRRLVGAEFFRAMAGVFLREHPPEDPRLQLWGGRFPGFLVRFEPVAHLPYLPDMARLELGLRQSYHAGDARPLLLAGRDPAEVLDLRPRLAPATLILPSRFPVLSIWRRNSGDAGLTIGRGPECILISRAGYDPEPRLLPEGGRTLARHLKGRLTLAEALTATQAAEPDADIAGLMRLFLGPGILTLQEGS
ncbi:DNA-binding domain-containing protein [Roseibacterium sp. SDUM158017]|uniref:HvfC/BufC N-terminal domain-containing protein n=1 Tax=Roseicyclus salinarum TaxID=3036773 RepID=UPI0024150BA6|nr:DNA-binding domain-containing protein [Roseibacterium sp. SDUM158017]MDG4649143.1 DNA-binding domain-containing protein [Roseibacterium sp. SDUM158017]